MSVEIDYCDHIEKNDYRKGRRVLVGSNKVIILCVMCSKVLEMEVLEDFIKDIAVRVTRETKIGAS